MLVRVFPEYPGLQSWTSTAGSLVRRRICLVAMMSRILGSGTPVIREQESRGPTARPMILVHEKLRFDPEGKDATVNTELASYFHPVIGPYDSADHDVLEYYVMLTRIAGLGGVAVDW